MPMPRLLSVWLSFKRLTQLGFPRRFPIVQFPNLPLIIAFLASDASKSSTALGTPTPRQCLT
jgi:hypothetical protein